MGYQPLKNVNPASFRDPSGFVFISDGEIYRQIQKNYSEHYDHLVASGLCQELISSRLLVPHTEVDVKFSEDDSAYKILKPERIPFISYPYEWSFSQLKDAAILTLDVQKKALHSGMLLKDSSAFNVQFFQGKPLLVDTLSFERYHEGEPWIAYRQFCQHFLAPLALMSKKDVRLNQLSKLYIDGVPLDLASELLPFSTRISPALLTHIHLHAKTQKKYADKPIQRTKYRISLFQLRALIDTLESAVRAMGWKPEGTEWGSYYEGTNYSETAADRKKRLVEGFLKITGARMVWDLGANTGAFSRIASEAGIQTIAFDVDAAAVEKNYREVKRKKETNLLPLLNDLTNPSPSIGFENKERMSLEERGPADCLFALALIHHLAISNNLPLSRIAEYFSRLGNWLIIEFVPKSDSQVQRLLSTRVDIFPDYTQAAFEKEFTNFYELREASKIADSERTLYLLRRRT